MPTWHPVQFVRCCRYFLRLHGLSRRKNNLGNNAKLALRADLWPAPGPVRAEAAFPKRHLVGLFRACLCFTPRVVISAKQIAEPGRLTRPLVRFLRHPLRFLRAGGRYRSSENRGRAIRTAWSPNHIANTDLRAARVKKYNRANFTGHSHETARGSSVSSSLAFLPAGRPSVPGSQPTPHRQRGTRSSLSAVVRIFFAYAVPPTGKIS